jgi:hypothetical protein
LFSLALSRGNGSNDGVALLRCCGASRKVQYVLDKSSPHVLFRWLGFAVLLSLYLLRVFLLNGWFIVTYGLGIYLLNNLIGFLSPQVRLTRISPARCACSPNTWSPALRLRSAVRPR